MTKHKRGKQSPRPRPLCAGPRTQYRSADRHLFGIPTYWSPEAALAIFEFVDEMRDIILGVYGTRIQDAARQRGYPFLDSNRMVPPPDLNESTLLGE